MVFKSLANIQLLAWARSVSVSLDSKTRLFWCWPLDCIASSSAQRGASCEKYLDASCEQSSLLLALLFCAVLLGNLFGSSLWRFRGDIEHTSPRPTVRPRNPLRSPPASANMARRSSNKGERLRHFAWANLRSLDNRLVLCSARGLEVRPLCFHNLSLTGNI